MTWFAIFAWIAFIAVSLGVGVLVIKSVSWIESPESKWHVFDDTDADGIPDVVDTEGDGAWLEPVAKVGAGLGALLMLGIGWYAWRSFK